MSDPNCTQCAEWEICPFHAPEDVDASAETERSVEAQSTPEPTWTSIRLRVLPDGRVVWGDPVEVCGDPIVCEPALRLLGPDDPEVSDDLIYATPDGGIVSGPVRLEAHFEALDAALDDWMFDAQGECPR